MADDPPPLAGLLTTLDLLLAQAQAYAAALGARDPAARVAVARLAELAQQARTEADSLAEIIGMGAWAGTGMGAVGAAPLPQPAPFSPREREVLALAARGLTNKEIAYRLGLSERTVQFHLNSVFNKTSTNSRTEAVAQALSRGWLGDAP